MYKNKYKNFAMEKFSDLYVEMTPEEEEIFNKYGPDAFIVKDDECIVNPNFEQEQADIEAERVNSLTMTALDFITFLQDAGLSLEQINAYLETNLTVKTQLTYCQNVYCGVAKSFMPVTVGDLTITAEMVETAFKMKNKIEDEQ